MSVGAVYTALIAVDAQTEWGTVLNYGFVERREQHVGLVAKLGNGDHQ